MTARLEIQIRDLVYEIMAILEKSDPSNIEVKIGARITRELRTKLQEHPAYYDKHYPHLNAAVQRVAEKIAVEKQVQVTAELVESVDQFLPDVDQTPELQDVKDMGPRRSESLNSTEHAADSTVGYDDVCLNGPLRQASGGGFCGLGGYRVQKSKAAAKNGFKGRLITASQLRCLWSCFLPQTAISNSRSRKRQGRGDGNESSHHTQKFRR